MACAARRAAAVALAVASPQVSSESLSQLLGVVVSVPVPISAEELVAPATVPAATLQIIIIVLVVAGALGVVLGIWAVRRQRKKDEKRERVHQAALLAGRRGGETKAYASPAVRRAFQRQQSPHDDSSDGEDR